jgi:hypothetical protein
MRFSKRESSVITLKTYRVPNGSFAGELIYPNGQTILCVAGAKSHDDAEAKAKAAGYRFDRQIRQLNTNRNSDAAYL